MNYYYIKNNLQKGQFKYSNVYKYIKIKPKIILEKVKLKRYPRTYFENIFYYNLNGFLFCGGYKRCYDRFNSINILLYEKYMIKKLKYIYSRFKVKDYNEFLEKCNTDYPIFEDAVFMNNYLKNNYIYDEKKRKFITTLKKRRGRPPNKY